MDSYNWILSHPDFQQLHSNQQNRLLWIKGGPGKGKTMLLCGIVNELKKWKVNLSYFFCQAPDIRINNAKDVLRGLMYLLVDQQPSLVVYIQKTYHHAGTSLFEDANAWIALTEIFGKMLEDPNLNNTYLIIDALDECILDLSKLLDFIVQKTSVSSRVKWIVSSRKDPNIEQRLWLDNSRTALSLELEENANQVSRAVNAYIDHRILELTELQYEKAIQDSVREKMRCKANGTFLWVSLAISELKGVKSWDMLEVLDKMLLELKDVYHQMITQVKRQPRYSELCRKILSIVTAAYRPLHLQELHVLSGLPVHIHNVIQSTAEFVEMCGSFLAIQDDNIYFIHQSAKDYLSQEANHDIFPCGLGNIHRSIFLRSLEIMSKGLERDIYRLRMLGCPIEKVRQPVPDPLRTLRYLCIYWVDHLYDWNSSSFVDQIIDLRDGGIVHKFLREQYLYWLEALSLCRSLSKGVLSIAKLETLVKVILRQYNPRAILLDV